MMDRRKLLLGVLVVIVALTSLTLYLMFRCGDTNDEGLKLVIDQDGGADDAMAIFMAALYEKYFNGMRVSSVVASVPCCTWVSEPNPGCRRLGSSPGGVAYQLRVCKDVGSDIRACFGPKLVALTTTFGNVDEEKVFINTQRILNIAGRRDVQIYRGSVDAVLQSIQSDYYYGEDGLGDNEIERFEAIPAENQHAAVALVELSKKYIDNLVIVAIGSLTNIALAIKLDPLFISRLRHLYVAAGNIEVILDDMVAEFNAAMDAEAYHIVAKNGQSDKLTFIPFSRILMYQNISNDWRINVLGSIPTKIMQMQNKFESANLIKTSYWSHLDPSAMAIALNETSIVEARYGHSYIELCGGERGITKYNFTDTKPTARIIYELNTEPYMEFLYKLFSADT